MNGLFDYVDDRASCPEGPHRGPSGPNEDIAQCWRCAAVSWTKRPANEQFGLHLDDCSLPIDHSGGCVGGGEGHPPAEIVRGYWPGMDADVRAARSRRPSA